LLRLLASQHEVHVLSLVHDQNEAAQVSQLASWVASVSAAPLNRRRRLVAAAAALPGSRPLTHVLLHSPGVRPHIERIVEATPPDVVIAYGTAMAQYVFEDPLTTVPCLLDMVDVDSEKWASLGATAHHPMRTIYRREARVLRQFERLAAERACATTVVNERERVLLETAVGHRAGVAIPNGVDIDGFRPTTPPGTSPQVVFCGVFNYGPNEDGAIWLARDVWPRVLARRHNATLMLVGAQPTARVVGLARDQSIHVTGAVPDVRPFLWNSAVAAAPLHLARGVQNKVLEAIAAGLPCVVTPPVLAGLPTCAHAACVAASEADAFADALISLLDVPPRNRRERAMSADLEGLRWPTQLAPFLDLVTRCADRSRHGRVS
jgi:sugar transferase (PEP-CTERM/EpsH1 system associated)